jgi:ferredoxin
MTLRVIVDRQRCIGAGTCLFIAPSAFGWRDGDFLKAEVLDPSTVEEDVIREAAAACPTQAILLEEVEETYLPGSSTH